MKTKATVESWKPIPAFEHKFHISDKGRVKNVLTGEIVEPIVEYGHKLVILECYTLRMEKYIFSMVEQAFGLKMAS